MSHKIHSQARSTPKIRAELQASQLSDRQLASQYNLSRQTVRKWRNRQSVDDDSHRPHRLCTTLSAIEEAIVIEIRCLLLLPLDDLLVMTREFINHKVSRAGLNRCLVRHGVANLTKLKAQLQAQNGIEPQIEPKKTFKDYESGFIHLDIKYLPKMPDEHAHRYLYVAIDSATRWVHLHIYANQTQESSVDFLNRVVENCPVKIEKILTDNGTQFTDRFTSKEKQPSSNHAFDKACKTHSIEHRLIPTRHPQTNGMVERFNGRISEIVKQTRFKSSAELESTLMRYLTLYNYQIPQRALKHQTPFQALKNFTKLNLKFLTNRYIATRYLTSILIPC